MVNTYSMNKPFAQDPEPHYCECGRVATFWSQDEGPGWVPLGQPVYHCKAHRNIARQKAGENKSERITQDVQVI